MLVAQTIARHLSITAGYQKYRINRSINHKTGNEELALRILTLSSLAMFPFAARSQPARWPANDNNWLATNGTRRWVRIAD